jgi:hypothetical protein
MIRHVERVTANLFVEPQYTVYKYGARVPHSQIYAGLSLQF